jgi:hypothetical protein
LSCGEGSFNDGCGSPAAQDAALDIRRQRYMDAQRNQGSHHDRVMRSWWQNQQE